MWQTKLGIASGSFCAVSETINCEAAAASSWSEIFSIPLGSWGMAFYFFLVVLVGQKFFTGFWSNQKIIILTLVSSVVASIFSLFLFYISWADIGVLCPLCVLLYLVNFLLLTISFIAFRRNAKVISSSTNQTLTVRQSFFACFTDLYQSIRSLEVKDLVEYLLFICAWGCMLLIASLSPKIAESNLKSQVGSWPVAQKLSASIDFEKDYHKGNLVAKIEIVEFADYECPACQQAASKINEWLMPYEGQYYFVYLNYPLDSSCNDRIPGQMHTKACSLAVLARCAGEQGKFWPAHYLINDSSQQIKEEALGEVSSIEASLIKKLSLNSELLSECISNPKTSEDIQYDIQRGNQVGVSSTPSVYINGQKLDSLSQSKIENIFTYLNDK